MTNFRRNPHGSNQKYITQTRQSTEHYAYLILTNVQAHIISENVKLLTIYLHSRFCKNKHFNWLCHCSKLYKNKHGKWLCQCSKFCKNKHNNWLCLCKQANHQSCHIPVCTQSGSSWAKRMAAYGWLVSQNSNWNSKNNWLVSQRCCADGRSQLLPQH